MSYIFDGANNRLTGAFTAPGYAMPLTTACFFKVVAHPVAVQFLVALGESAGANPDSINLISAANVNDWGSRYIDPSGTSTSSGVDENVDGVWTGLVGLFPDENSRRVYVKDITQTDNSTVVLAASGGTLDQIQIGESLSDASDFGAANPNESLIAEVAMWNVILTTQEVTDYLSGISASVIAPSNLIGYWSLSADGVLTNAGIDTGGDLTATGTTFSADHPTITIPGASTKRRRMNLMGVG
jgi:hypothetical protein